MTNQEVNTQEQQVVTPDQAEFLAKKPVELVTMPDGSIATGEEVERMREGDQDIAGSYGGRVSH